MKLNVYATATVTCILALAGSSASAQNDFEIGIKYYIEKSELINKSDQPNAALNKESTMSYLDGGLSVGYNITHRLGLEADVLRSRQGQIYTGNDPASSTNAAAYTRDVVLQSIFNNDPVTGSYQAKAELNCVKVPFMIKLSTDRARTVSFHVLAGPEIDIITNVVYEHNHEDITLEGTNITPNDAYRRVTLDGIVSGGADIKLTKRIFLTANVLTDYGFEDVEKKNLSFSYMGAPDENYYGPGRAATHNFTAGLLVGVSYKL